MTKEALHAESSYMYIYMGGLIYKGRLRRLRYTLSEECFFKVIVPLYI